jgi:hypothetical protein
VLSESDKEALLTEREWRRSDWGKENAKFFGAVVTWDTLQNIQIEVLMNTEGITRQLENQLKG